jgi:hypothetical protein
LPSAFLRRGCRSTFGTGSHASRLAERHHNGKKNNKNAELWVVIHHGESAFAIELLPSCRTRSQMRSRRPMHTFLPPLENIPGDIFCHHWKTFLKTFLPGMFLVTSFCDGYPYANVSILLACGVNSASTIEDIYILVECFECFDLCSCCSSNLVEYSCYCEIRITLIDLSEILRTSVQHPRKIVEKLTNHFFKMCFLGFLI